MTDILSDTIVIPIVLVIAILFMASFYSMIMGHRKEIPKKYKYKRTFQEYLHRELELSGREMKIRALWHITLAFSPWDAIWARKKFNRVLKRIREERRQNDKEGYYVGWLASDGKPL